MTFSRIHFQDDIERESKKTNTLRDSNPRPLDHDALDQCAVSCWRNFKRLFRTNEDLSKKILVRSLGIYLSPISGLVVLPSVFSTVYSTATVMQLMTIGTTNEAATEPAIANTAADQAICPEPDNIPVVVISMFADYASGEVVLDADHDTFRWITAGQATEYDFIDGIAEEIVMLDQHLKGEPIPEVQHYD